MSKIEKLLADYEKAQASVEGLKGEISSLEKDLIRLEAEADAAAKEGDVTLYQAKREEAKTASDKLFVRRKQLEGTTCLRSEEEAGEAWREYADAYNKTFAKNWAAYMKARESLYHDFLALVHGQEAALSVREKCAACCGLDPGEISGIGNALDSTFPLQMLPDRAPAFRLPQLRTPDPDFFLRVFGADLDLFNRVIRLHLPR